MKLKKSIFSLAVSIFMILGLGQNVIYGATGSLISRLEIFRRLPVYNETSKTYTQNKTNWGFRIGDGENRHPIYQISEVQSSTGENVFIGDNTRLYCLNAKEGDTWNGVIAGGDIDTPVEYNINYDLKKDKTKISQELGNNKVYDIANYEYYSSIIWLLDNFYIPNRTNKEEFFAKIDIEKNNEKHVDITDFGTYVPYLYNGEYKFGQYGNMFGYNYLDENKNVQDVLLPDELIETVQQAVIWYFTNYLDSSNKTEDTFNCLQDKDESVVHNWLYYTTGEVDTENKNKLLYYSLAENYKIRGYNNQEFNVGKMYQEQAAILYKYLVDEALVANENGYTGDITTASIDSISYNKVSKQQDGKFKIGPVAIETKGEVSNIELQIQDNMQQDVIFTMQDKDGNVITKLTENNIKEGFYIISEKEEVTIIATGKGKRVKQTLWTYVNETNDKTEQPIVEIDTVEEDLSKSIPITKEKVFDLALRKLITKVKKADGTEISIKNEQGLSAIRDITEDYSTIPNTATYKHRKDPVVVQTGYKVTYQLNIYNEGDINGYASIIIDQLPNGLVSTLKVGDKITSTKENEYEVISYDNNKLVLELISSSPNVINAYNTKLDKEIITLECEVTQVEDKEKHYLTNIAYINEAYSVEGNVVTKQEQDRKNTESKPGEYPSKTENELHNTDTTNLYKGNSNYSIFNDGTNNEVYFSGQEDDDDFETIVLLPKEFDLKLVKYISAINGEKSNRVITVDSSKLNKTVNGTKITTADYNVSKLPITVKTGDYVTYTFRIYNEAEIDGYASEITENIPKGLEYVYSTLTTDAQIDADTSLSEKEKEAIKFNRNYGWGFTDDTLKNISTQYLSKVSTDNLIKAFDSSKDNGKGEGLSYKEVSVMFKVISTDVTKIIRNEAAITEDTDAEGTPIKDRDSDTEAWKKENSDDYYDNQNYPKYKEDDEDYDNIKLVRFDIALRKFITAISADSTIDKVEYISTKIPSVDTSKLKTGENQTAIYNHSKAPITLNAGDYVLYTIRVYNESDLDGYASKITDYLPQYLNYIENNEINVKYGWDYAKDENGKVDYRTIDTTYLSSEKGTSNKLEAFDAENDNGKGSGLSYKDIQILCRVSLDAVSDKNITNIAEITEYQDEKGTVIDIDPDSNPNNLKYPQDVPAYEGNKNGDNASSTYYPGQEDDDDFDRVIVQEPKFDLALRKFITKINNEDVTTRIPTVTYKDEKITYTHPKDVLKVSVGDTVTYTIRIFNEGKTAGFAETVTDDIPEYLEYLPKNATNVAYRWKMYDKDGKETEDVTKVDKIVTDYTSKAYGEKIMQEGENITENPNLLNSFNPSSEISDTNPEYVDVKVAFKVLDPDSSKYIIKNKAQISEDSDENGNPVTDIDSIPNEWNDGEDDQDHENVSVEYFDLALLKYVSEVEVTEKGKTITTKTGNKGDKNDIIPKVEIHKKKLNSTTVKFIYTIKVTNEGDIPGYVKELTDYVPEGLEFNTEDNKGWEEKEDGIIVTKLLSDTLLNPGESAKVKVTFRWINDEDNLGIKTNIAEISEDDNERGIPDRDSTPGNKKSGEDDIDDADVLLSIKTGNTENIIAFIAGGTIILIVLASGVILIKKYVL